MLVEPFPGERWGWVVARRARRSHRGHPRLKVLARTLTARLWIAVLTFWDVFFSSRNHRQIIRRYRYTAQNPPTNNVSPLRSPHFFFFCVALTFRFQLPRSTRWEEAARCFNGCARPSDEAEVRVKIAGFYSKVARSDPSRLEVRCDTFAGCCAAGHASPAGAWEGCGQSLGKH